MDSATVNALCAPYRTDGDSRFQLFQCVHGMGHGFQMMYAGDLPRALGSCDQLADPWDRESCYGGVFMENIVNEIAPHHPSTKLVQGHHARKRSPPSRRSIRPICCTRVRSWSRNFGGPATRFKPPPSSTSPITASGERPRCARRRRRTCSRCARRAWDGTSVLGPFATRRNPSGFANGVASRTWMVLFRDRESLDRLGGKPSDGMALCRRLGESVGWELCFQGVGEQVASSDSRPGTTGAGLSRGRATRGRHRLPTERRSHRRNDSNGFAQVLTRANNQSPNTKKIPFGIQADSMGSITPVAPTAFDKLIKSR